MDEDGTLVRCGDGVVVWKPKVFDDDVFIIQTGCTLAS